MPEFIDMLFIGACIFAAFAGSVVTAGFAYLMWIGDGLTIDMGNGRYVETDWPSEEQH